MRTRLPLSALLFTAACVPSTQPPAVPAPPRPGPVRQAPLPAPAPIASDWRDWPLTPGTWTYRRDQRGGIARFGTSGAPPRLTLRCDRAARQIIVSHAGTSLAPLTIRTTSSTRAIAVEPSGDSALVIAALPANDPLLDAMGFSRGRFVVEHAGAPPLVIPAWAEIERVTEDCRG